MRQVGVGLGVQLHLPEGVPPCRNPGVPTHPVRWGRHAVMLKAKRLGRIGWNVTLTTKRYLYSIHIDRPMVSKLSKKPLGYDGES
jgi:hypothetical protein